MRKVTLQFPNVDVLWAFAKNLKAQEFKVNTRNLQLTCVCEESFIEEALSFYKARVVSDQLKSSL